jgi:hypothetical protein
MLISLVGPKLINIDLSFCCGKNSGTAACSAITDCVTADQKNLLAAKVRIAVGHRYKQNFYFINTIESEQF